MPYSVFVLGFSAICVIIWGVLMHIFVDLQYMQMDEDEKPDILSSTSIPIIPIESLKTENVSTMDNFSDILAQPSVPTDASIRGKTTYDKCWKGYSNYNFLWIITGPMTLVLFVSM